MIYIPFSKKIKVWALSVAMLAGFAVAGEGNMNYYGQLGVHKTQSAQTLGHGRLGLGMFFDIATGLNTIIEEGGTFHTLDANGKDSVFGIANYAGFNVYPSLSFGLSDYFDLSLSIPGYFEYLKVGDGSKSLTAGGQGDLFVSAKGRVPFDDSFPIDIALILGMGMNTGKPNADMVNDYGPWIRDPMFLNVNTMYPVGSLTVPTSSYTSTNSFMKLGFAGTLDFNRMKIKIPLLLHLNYAYRTPLGAEGVNYPKVQSFSSALEWTPMQFASFFGEYYIDMPTTLPKGDVDLNTFSIGSSFHLSKNTDFQLGAQIFAGDKNKYIDNLALTLDIDNEDNIKKAVYNGRLIPDLVIFAGFTVKLFTVEPEVIEEEEEEEEEEYRNPDTDEDGVCDPWVSETGRQREFKHTCSGIDLCPYEAGPMEGKGCTVKKVEAAAPTIWFSASPDVINKGQSVTLTWQVNNASIIEIEGIGAIEPSGSKKVKPTENTTYTLTAIGDGGTRISSVDIEVASGPVPVILFTASSDSVQKGQSVTLTWQVTNASTVSIEGIGKVQASGSRKIKMTESAVYTLTAVGEGGEQIATVEVEVAEPPPIEARVNLQGVTFGSGNATLTPNAKKVLDGVAEQLLANPKVKIEIQGHTDNQGKPAANQDLSYRRAKSVVGYLATKGVSMSRMRAVGYGQDVPIEDNRTAEGRELNRRIEMIRIDD